MLRFEAQLRIMSIFSFVTIFLIEYFLHTATPMTLLYTEYVEDTKMYQQKLCFIKPVLPGTTCKTEI